MKELAITTPTEKWEKVMRKNNLVKSHFPQNFESFVFSVVMRIMDQNNNISKNILAIKSRFQFLKRFLSHLRIICEKMPQ